MRVKAVRATQDSGWGVGGGASGRLTTTCRPILRVSIVLVGRALNLFNMERSGKLFALGLVRV